MNSIIRTPWPWAALAVLAGTLVAAGQWPHLAVIIAAAGCFISGMGIQRHRTETEPRR
ncbi:hypothetical protein [Nesterenkonia sp. HG001]|uniref:hypothetical protein n=1 Tax=Nesterenkonia sp. HG001 TaxID=2983207 RepID=UPI002AC43498|nr:hypothetical protein [Nesterenkonia sp. HG001]MDZ5077852.1 hypothetical protein [Nesterenkonia sp. HG001]